MSLCLKTLSILACLAATSAPARCQETQAEATPGKTYFAQVQLVRVIPIQQGGAKVSVAMDLRRIAAASCSRAHVAFIKNSIDIYAMEVKARTVQYSASIQCK